MGMGRKKDREKQEDLWVAFSEIVTTPGHVFYERLNAVLNAEKFDQRIEVICRKYYKSSSVACTFGADNVFKRVLVQAAAFNIGVLLRTLSGWGKPRQAQGRLNRLQALFFAAFAVFRRLPSGV